MVENINIPDIQITLHVQSSKWKWANQDLITEIQEDVHVVCEKRKAARFASTLADTPFHSGHFISDPFNWGAKQSGLRLRIDWTHLQSQADTCSDEKIAQMLNFSKNHNQANWKERKSQSKRLSVREAAYKQQKPNT